MNRPRGDARRCFVCGPDNPIGLKLAFKVEGQRCSGEFTSCAEHAGFDGVTHEFFGMGAVVTKARDAVNFAASQLKKALG